MTQQTTVLIYTIPTESMDSFVPSFAEKMYNSDIRCTIIHHDQSTVDDLNKKLWTYKKLSFIPHAVAHNTPKPQEQPILLSTNPSDCVKNTSKILIVLSAQSIANLTSQDITSYNLNKLIIITDNTPKELLTHQLICNHKTTIYSQKDGQWHQKTLPNQTVGNDIHPQKSFT